MMFVGDVWDVEGALGGGAVDTATLSAGVEAAASDTHDGAKKLKLLLSLAQAYRDACATCTGVEAPPVKNEISDEDAICSARISVGSAVLSAAARSHPESVCH